MRRDEVKEGKRVQIVGGRGDGKRGIISKVHGGKRGVRTCDVRLSDGTVLEKIGQDYLLELPNSD